MDDLSSSVKKGSWGHGRYYSAPTEIRDVPGLARLGSVRHFDLFRGTAEAIAASGILPIALLPGQPGVYAGSVTYRPAGITKAREESWSSVPGYLIVRRDVSGTFWLCRTVGYEEQETRAAVRKAERERCEDEWRRELEAEKRAQQKFIEDVVAEHFPRPNAQAQPPKPTHLRLVWSAPAST